MAEGNKKSLLGSISQWPRGRKISLVVVTLVTVAAFALLILQYRTADYRVLFANLSNADASSVVEWLKERNQDKDR